MALPWAISWAADEQEEEAVSAGVPQTRTNQERAHAPGGPPQRSTGEKNTDADP